MPRKYRPDVAYPAELAQENRHFTSGVNAPGEARGLAMSGRHFGISLGEIRRGLLAELEIYGGGLQELFVDTGAFSEVDFPEDGPPVVTREIPHAEWIRRYAIAERLAAAYRTKARIVAPDRVGCQRTTLERLARYGHLVAACAAHRASIIVPVQKGEMTMGDFFRRACEVLGLRETPIAGIPMKKDATTLAELGAFVETLPWYGARIHLLGLGPRARYGMFQKVIRLIRSIRPNADITSDSTQAICGEVGRDNGRHGVRGETPGGPRRLTAAQDRARELGLRGQEIKAYGLTETGWLELAEDRDRAAAAGWRDVELDDDEEEPASAVAA